MTVRRSTAKPGARRGYGSPLHSSVNTFDDGRGAIVATVASGGAYWMFRIVVQPPSMSVEVVFSPASPFRNASLIWSENVR